MECRNRMGRTFILQQLLREETFWNRWLFLCRIVLDVLAFGWRFKHLIFDEEERQNSQIEDELSGIQ